jgi:glycosyltransferase involved in cell wall biosynthesis
MLGARVFLDMRDPFPEFFQAKYFLQARHPLVRGLIMEEKWSARFATQIVTVHDSMADLYTRTGIPRENIAVVMNAPDPRLFDTEPTHSHEPADRTMLYTGTVARWYGVELAVRAIARLRDEIPELRLRIVGDGQLVPELREMVVAEGIEDRVLFDDPVPLDLIPDIVAVAWVGIQPNRADPLMRYSLSTKVLEWCRLGLPVICGETKPLLEVFRDGEVMFHKAGDLDGLCARLLEAHVSSDALVARAARAKIASQRIGYEEEIAKLLELIDG